MNLSKIPYVTKEAYRWGVCQFQRRSVLAVPDYSIGTSAILPLYDNIRRSEQPNVFRTFENGQWYIRSTRILKVGEFLSEKYDYRTNPEYFSGYGYYIPNSASDSLLLPVGPKWIKLMSHTGSNLEAISQVFQYLHPDQTFEASNNEHVKTAIHFINQLATEQYEKLKAAQIVDQKHSTFLHAFIEDRKQLLQNGLKANLETISNTK